MVTPTKIQVRFSDVDMMSHVNNAVYLSYFEYARMDFFEQLLGKDWDWQKKGIILMKNEIEYLIPVRINDEPIVEIGVEHLGNKSFVLNYDLKVNNQTYTKGLSTLVAYDYSKGKSVAIHSEMEAALRRLKEEQ